MQREFVVRDLHGEVTGRFAISFCKADGVRYSLGEGGVCWQDAVGAITLLAKRMSIPRKVSESDMELYKGSYKVIPDSEIEIRYSPVLVNEATLKREKLPFTVDGNEFMEHHWEMPYDTAIKMLLALSMSYDGNKLTVDLKKIAKINRSRTSKSSVEVRI